MRGRIVVSPLCTSFPLSSFFETRLYMQKRGRRDTYRAPSHRPLRKARCQSARTGKGQNEVAIPTTSLSPARKLPGRHRPTPFFAPVLPARERTRGPSTYRAAFYSLPLVSLFFFFLSA
ncbi:hypothetical protein PUN28_009261 [Cardiocondyla obscurior]|uniref:Transmembrane protein n=1 Tax=Cardiocondyla obscurior TaxID=286306 RepID=A0AAW2FUP3_9HYME